MRRRIGLLILLILAAAPSAAPSLSLASAGPTGQVIDVVNLLDRVDQQRLREHIDAIDEPRNAFTNPEALEATGEYIEAQLESLGYPVRLDSVPVATVVSTNVIGVHEGTACPERVFVVGAHYDSVTGTPGADDDASGVAGMLEIARALADTPLPATIWFAGFTLEEDGLAGSVNMAQDAVADGTPIVGMFSLEMIGYTVDAPGGDFIAVIGNEASVRLVDAFNRAHDAYVPELVRVAFTVPGNGETMVNTRRSDHVPFWDAGYQGLLVTDTANFRNPNYHGPTDTIDTLDLEFAANVTKAMLATTVDYLTYDGDADGRPDACSGPLAATPAPTSATGTAQAATGTPTGGPPTELPPAGDQVSDGADDAMPLVAWVIAGGAAAAVALSAGLLVWHPWRRR